MTERWVSFDCFGTLVDWNAGFAAILERAGARRARDLVEAYHRHEPVVEAANYRSYREVTRLALEQAISDLGSEFGLSPTAIADEWATLPVFPDTRPALARLREDGWMLAVLTNCDVDLFEQTAPTLGVTIDRVITAEHVHSYKPALAHFHRFRETINDAPWIHVACSWFHDIVPARTVGVPRIWVDRERTGEDPAIATRVIPNLESLPAIVRLVMR